MLISSRELFLRATEDMRKSSPPEKLRYSSLCEDLLLLGAASDTHIKAEKLKELIKRHAIIRKAQTRRDAIKKGIARIGNTLVTVKQPKIDLLVDCSEAVALCQDSKRCEDFFVKMYMENKAISAVLEVLRNDPDPANVDIYIPKQERIRL